MQNYCLKKPLANIIYLSLIITIAILPVGPVSSIAAEVKNDTATVVLDDQSKTEVLETTSETTVTTPPAENAETSPTPEATTTTPPAETPETSPTPEATSKEGEEGMSTGMKYTLGVGGAVVALVGIAALAGGSSDSPPTPPTEEQMLGPWTANANAVDGRTYSGTYTLYSGGSHSYDIYVSDGNHKVGSGAWKLVDYNFELRNYSGSTYRGTFAQGVKNTVTTYTTDGRWKNVLTK
jgi:cytoskeletal protein RodZ